MTATNLVLCECRGSVVTLTLNRSGMHNALVPELLEALLGELRRLHADPAIRAVVLAANGPAFSIGGDMRRFAAEAAQGAANLRRYSAGLVGLLNDAVLAMTNLPQPIVGAIHGTVTGGSLGFLVGADLLVLADDAAIKAHYASAGYCPDGGWTAILPTLIGNRRTAAALMLNRSIRAQEALDWGWATELAGAPEVLPRAQALADKIAAFPVGTMQISKRLLNAQVTELAARLEAERRGFLELVASDAAIAGVQSFLEKFTTYPGGAST